MKNKLSDLNDHLFAQLERLSDEDLTPEQIESEAKRGEAIVGVADRIISGASLKLQAAKVLADHGVDPAQLISDAQAMIDPSTSLMIEAKKPQ